MERVLEDDEEEVVEEEDGDVEVWIDVEQLVAEVAVAGGCAVQQDFWLPTVCRENTSQGSHRRLS